jgi:hypothetical protein
MCKDREEGPRGREKDESIQRVPTSPSGFTMTQAQNPLCTMKRSTCHSTGKMRFNTTSPQTDVPHCTASKAEPPGLLSASTTRTSRPALGMTDHAMCSEGKVDESVGRGAGRSSEKARDDNVSNLPTSPPLS